MAHVNTFGANSHPKVWQFIRGVPCLGIKAISQVTLRFSRFWALKLYLVQGLLRM